MSEARTTDKNLMTGYEAVRNDGVGLIDLSARARISMSGSEAVTFLNGLITNDVKTLDEKRWLPAAFANVQGRLLASVRLIRRANDILLDTEDVTREKVLKIIERFTLAGDFKVADLTGESALISLQGRGASAFLEKITLPDDTTVVPATHTGEAGFDLIVSAAQKDKLQQSLLAAGAVGVSAEVEEILRIEAGIARYGVDMDETNVVTETNLDDAVSYTKGCYLGQEIIVRIKHRGHVAKKLTGLRFETEQAIGAATEQAIEPGALIRSIDDKEIGRVTSATFSPALGTTVALGYVRYEHLPPDRPILVNNVAGSVQSLPLIRGSWYES
jgi:folate-binding protein YgfZ